MPHCNNHVHMVVLQFGIYLYLTCLTLFLVGKLSGVGYRLCEPRKFHQCCQVSSAISRLTPTTSNWAGWMTYRSVYVSYIIFKNCSWRLTWLRYCRRSRLASLVHLLHEFNLTSISGGHHNSDRFVSSIYSQLVAMIELLSQQKVLFLASLSLSVLAFVFTKIHTILTFLIDSCKTPPPIGTPCGRMATGSWLGLAVLMNKDSLWYSW